MNTTQKEVMLIAQEECAEVIQAISKIFRFGLNEEYNQQTNKQRLEEETGDLLCMIQMLIEQGVIDETLVNRASVQKRIKLQKWSGVFQQTEKEFIN